MSYLPSKDLDSARQDLAKKLQSKVSSPPGSSSTNRTTITRKRPKDPSIEALKKQPTTTDRVSKKYRNAHSSSVKGPPSNGPYRPSPLGQMTLAQVSEEDTLDPEAREVAEILMGCYHTSTASELSGPTFADDASSATTAVPSFSDEEDDGTIRPRKHP